MDYKVKFRPFEKKKASDPKVFILSDVYCSLPTRRPK